MSKRYHFELIEKKRERQNACIELIASENFVSDKCDESHGKCLNEITYARRLPRQEILRRLRSGRRKQKHWY